jgi:hypothetical protein
MRPIAVFYHCLFALGTPDNIRDKALTIVQQQMDAACVSGLAHEASHFVIGINGGEESRPFAEMLLPRRAIKVYHGLESRAENLTIVELEKWLPSHPGWNVLYFHAKGCTHPPGDPYGEGVSGPWRDTMTRYLVMGWRNCVLDLESGFESVGCHFLTGMADGTQNIWAGNFFWATSDFLMTLPSIYKRDRIKVSGIAAAESRYEAEVWIGNGARIPHVKQYLPKGGEGVP